MNKNKKFLSVFGIVAVLIFSIILTLGPKLMPDADLPTWQDVFRAVGFFESDKATQAPLSVHFIDVGQGDSIFIMSEHGNALVDSGDRGNAPKILDYIKSRGVYKLDYIFVTHYHADRMGSMAEIIEGIEVGQIVLPDVPKKMLPTTRSFENLLLAIKKENVKRVIAKTDDVFRLEDLFIKVVGPVEKYDNMNDLSLVLRIDYKEISYLLTGDAEAQSENGILSSKADIKVNILKAGHHGSNTSSGAEFLKAVSPELVIITCGRDNSYGHPHREVLRRIDKIGAKVLRTDYFGDIVVYSDGKSLDYIRLCKVKMKEWAQNQATIRYLRFCFFTRFKPAT